MEEKDEKDINWDELARSILQLEEETKIKIKKLTSNEIIRALVLWKEKNYIATFQEIAPDFSKEIILLAKSTNPLKIELINAIKKLDKGRFELYADDNIDLEGRQHILRRVGNKIMYLTPSQTLYMIDQPVNIEEI